MYYIHKVACKRKRNVADAPKEKEENIVDNRKDRGRGVAEKEKTTRRTVRGIDMVLYP